MEKPKSIIKNNNTSPIKKNEQLSSELKRMWGSMNGNGRKKNDKKKLIIKLETSGKENRKIMLKLESGKSTVAQNNYNLLSELLKEFFSN